MKKFSSFFLLLILFIFLRIILVLTHAPKLGFCESFRAIAAYDFVTDRKFNIFDYTFRHNEGGSLVVSLIAAIFFKIFGINLISPLLVPILFSLSAFIIGYKLLKKYCGLKEAIFFALIFIFPSQTYIALSLLILGNHIESILFTLTICYFLGNILLKEDLSLKKESFYASLLGLICGFSIWFAYINIIGVLTCIFCIFIFDRAFFIRNSVLFFITFFIIGISPLIIYNIVYAHGGVGIVLYKPLYAHFLDIGFKKFGTKAAALFFYDIPFSLFFTNGFLFSRKVLIYSTYLIYIFVIFCFIYKKTKSCGLKSLMNFHKNRKQFLNTFIIAYLIIFILVYLFSDFRVEHSNVEQGKGFRYIASIFPLFIMLFSQAFVFLLRKRYIYRSIFYLVIILNLVGIIKLVDFDNFLKSAKTSPVSPAAYQSFGWSIGNKFGSNFKKCVSYSNKLESSFQKFYFWGLGEGIVRSFLDNPEESQFEFKNIPEKYRLLFYTSLGLGIGDQFYYEAKEAIKKLNTMKKEYVKYILTGIGVATGVNRFEKISTITDYIKDDEYLCSFYEGVGAAVLYLSGFNLKGSNDMIVDSPEIEERYKFCCFQGMSLVFPDEKIGSVKKYYNKLESSANEINDKFRYCFLQSLHQKRYIFEEIFK